MNPATEDYLTCLNCGKECVNTDADEDEQFCCDLCKAKFYGNAFKCRNCQKEYLDSDAEEYEDFCCATCEGEHRQEESDAREIMLTENQLLKDHEGGR